MSIIFRIMCPLILLIFFYKLCTIGFTKSICYLKKVYAIRLLIELSYLNFLLRRHYTLGTATRFFTNNNQFTMAKV